MDEQVLKSGNKILFKAGDVWPADNEHFPRKANDSTTMKLLNNSFASIMDEDDGGARTLLLPHGSGTVGVLQIMCKFKNAIK